MTSRERVVAALGHRRPDRIPRYEIFLEGFVKAWQGARGAGADVYEGYPKVDIRTVLANQDGPFISRVSREETGGDVYYERDSWGRWCRHSHGGTFFEVLETALADKAGLDGLVFEDAWTEARREGYRRWAGSLEGSSAPVSGVMGLFMPSYYLRGEFQLLMDLVEDEGFCAALAGRLGEFLGGMGEEVLDCTGTWDTAIWVYDELGTNKTSIISPGTFERVYLGAYAKMISRWKARGAKNVILHCDGNILPLIELLIAAGFTGIQGNNPSAGMTVPEMRRRYGERLALIGGMCNIHVLPSGTRAEIRRQAESIVEVAKGGGVVIGAHSIDSDVPVEAYDYYYSVLDELDEGW